MARLRRLAKVTPSAVDKKEREDDQRVELCSYTHVYYNDFIDGNLDFEPSTADEGDIERFGLRRGDVIITKDSESWDDIGVPALVTEDIPGVVCAYHLFVIRTRSPAIRPRFLFWGLNSRFIAYQLEGAATGVTRYGLTTGDVLDARVPLPPTETQSQIAAFLDHNTARIDQLIEKEQHLLELLEEKRHTLATEYVTRGLDKEAALADTGIDWLGEIPAHWNVVRTRFLCRVTTGSGDTQDASDDGEFPFIVRSPEVLRSDTYTFEGEGVLTSGDGAGVGEIFHHIDGKFHFHQRVYLFHDFQNVVPRFFYHYLKELFAAVALTGEAKSTVDSLRRRMILDFPVALPPLDEQDRIVEAIEESDQHIEELMEAVQEQISLLKEKRQALITAAVTGQIDVTDWEPPKDTDPNRPATQTPEGEAVEA